WRPGDAFPDEHSAAASGAAFMAVVAGQMANAFACRSATRWPGSLGWTTNRLLLLAIPAGLAFAALVLFVGPIADELGQEPPPAAGWVFVALAAPVLLAVDAFDKHRAARAVMDGGAAFRPFR